MRDVEVPLAHLGIEPVRQIFLGARRDAILHAPDQHRHRAAGMDGDEADVRIAEHHAVDDDAGDGARDVEVELEHRRGGTVFQVAAAGRRERVHVDDRVAPIELLPHRLEIRVAGPAALVVVGVDADAVDLQRDRRRTRSP